MSHITDKQRIDWLEKTGSLQIERVKYFLSEPAQYEVTPFDCDSFDGENLRDAIDAAMRASNATGEAQPHTGA